MQAATPPNMAAIADNEEASEEGEYTDAPVSCVLLLGPATPSKLSAGVRGETAGAEEVAAAGEGVVDAATLLAEACCTKS